MQFFESQLQMPALGGTSDGEGVRRRETGKDTQGDADKVFAALAPQKNYYQTKRVTRRTRDIRHSTLLTWQRTHAERYHASKRHMQVHMYQRTTERFAKSHMGSPVALSHSFSLSLSLSRAQHGHVHMRRITQPHVHKQDMRACTHTAMHACMTGQGPLMKKSKEGVGLLQ